MSHTAFFYGTLMAPPVLQRVIYGSPPNIPIQASGLSTRPAILHHYQRHKVKSADYPAIVPSASTSASVRGTFVQGLTDGDIWRLDIFEGSEYKRVKVPVKVLEQADHSQTNGPKNSGMGDLGQPESSNVEGEELQAEVYVWIAGEHRLESEEWDFTEFVKDKMARWVGREGAEADEGFQDVDDAVAALPNDPTGGRGANGDISKALSEQDTTSDQISGSAV